MVRKNGEVYAISIEAISCQRAGKWSHYPFIIKKEYVNDWGYVRDAALTPSDKIWVPLTNGFLYYYDGRNWESKQINRWLGVISANPDGPVWIVDNSSGPEEPIDLGRQDVHGNTTYKTLPPNISSYSFMTAMQGARADSVWFGSGAGYMPIT